ncbi:peptidylprolyl isomerase [Algoriphagus sp. C2-6-M1]|uniref:peptidylprolyl isomerase n=1 Tax=Algoriphagus persicinus TaxID=3108754 RepID=UPI002B3F3A25|nr:peptidylprolyl isomerase [Algoriphagus sp. C2-6-M1]MEB2782384.1 peptidylprolyl isomerase [Algoriphagus sp. C2-6-M1]
MPQVRTPEGLHRLDGDYTVFGQVINGMNVIEQIVRVKRDSKNQPIKVVTLSVKIIRLPIEKAIQL